MPRYKVAHVKEQGVNLIIIPLDSAFGRKIRQEQGRIIAELQVRSNAAGLAGTVVPVWDGGGGRMSSMAPPRWHPFFRSLDLGRVWASVNQEIFW
jgi:hypothetical protein